MAVFLAFLFLFSILSHATALVLKDGEINRPVVFASDFASTLTSSDTTYLLFEAAVNSSFHSTAEKEAVKQKLDELEKLYYDQTAEYKKKFKFPSAGHSSHYNDRLLRQFLDGYDDLLLQSVQRLHQHKCLAKISSAGLSRAGLLSRPLLRAEVAMLPQVFGDIEVVSLNWSKQMVQVALSNPKYNLHCSELEQDRQGITTGIIQLSMYTAQDKEAHMKKMRLNFRNPKTFVIFVGDSLGDILAWLAADVGFVIGNSKSLRQVAAASGVQIQPLSSFPDADLLELEVQVLRSIRYCHRLVFAVDSLAQILELAKQPSN